MALASVPAGAAPRGTRDECRRTVVEEHRLESIGMRGELVLASGRRAVLAGLHWADDDAIAREATEWLSRSHGLALTLTIRGEPDRWGRVRADAVTLGADPVDLAAGLISAGLALTDAGEGDVLCRPELLALEEAPRSAARGIWATPVLDARAGGKLEDVAGDFVVAQGRVVSVGERPKRSYLNFVSRGESGLTVTVSKRTWRIMQEHGLSASTLKGRLVRVRGRIEIWRGPVLDLVNADMVELLDGEQAQQR